MRKITEIRVDFSLRREVFFVVIGAIVGAVTFVIPKAIFEVEMGLPYYLTWVAFGHVVGFYSSESVIAGIAIHMLTAISIGIVVGIFLYKTGILNISKLSNGLLYGVFAGLVVFVVFFIPVYQLVLAPEIAHTMKKMNLHISQNGEAYEAVGNISNNNFVTIMVGSVITHLVFGVTLGLITSLLSIRFGSRYRCSICDISFSRIDSYQKHMELIHGAKPIRQRRILILGGGFAGVRVLTQLQKAFQNDVSIDITLVSRDNFLLFTPMLPEVSSGMIETRNIVTPIRAFCNRAKFYEANIESVDLKNKQVEISHAIGKQTDPIEWRNHTLNYDYLVVALGSETNFFGMTEVARNAFTMKTISDAIVLRNHVINMLEQADLEHDDISLRKSLMTFVVVGGGFSGVETVGELNDFIRDSLKHFYHNLELKDVSTILVNSGRRILPEVTDDLSNFALQKLRESGVQVMLNTRLIAVRQDGISLNDGNTISTNTLVWAGGARPDPLISGLQCKHDNSGRMITNNYLEVQEHEDSAFALGDCASIIDPNTGNPCPPTAQHALRQGNIAANNIFSKIRESEHHLHHKKKVFDYKTKGVMTLIGRRNGVGILLGHKVQGLTAWFFWRFYYLSTLPTIQKKLRVMTDWFIDLFFKRDVTRLKTPLEEKGTRSKFKDDKQKEDSKKMSAVNGVKINTDKSS
ncbi:MAG: FAD-dependent oxidoreductase [Nitrososphaeraceae archaeon]